MTDMKGSTSTNTNIHAMHKEWDEALCPICMDHPHNAVLLVCSSHENGCRSYICDTSYRHSNCLDRFKKLTFDNMNSSQTSPPSPNPDSSSLATRPLNGHTEPIVGSSSADLEESHEHFSLDEHNIETSGGIVEETLGEGSSHDSHRYSVLGEESNVEMGVPESFTERIELDISLGTSSDMGLNLQCPLCRGIVKELKIVKEARKYLDLKHRSCSGDSCAFSGNYRELRRHARRVHPTARPSDINPSRQLAWRRLENQREYNDIISAIRAATPSAIVLGDYVIDNGNGISGEGRDGSRLADTFFLFQMISASSASRSEPWGLSRALRRSSSSGRRYLWGENLLGLQDDEDDWNLSSDRGEDISPVPRRRRRFSRSERDENL